MMLSGSCEYSNTELEMQAVPPTMTTMQETQWTDYHPIASLDSYHAPIEFTIPPHTDYYTDLSHTYLYLKFRVLLVATSMKEKKSLWSIISFTVCSVALIYI